MPIDPIIGTAISAGGNILSDGINAISQGLQNRASRKWSEKRYNIERADAITDWNRQNTYNSPAEQMKRMQAAGLNPRLMYGSGSSGGGNADQIRSTDSKLPTFRAPEFQSPGQIGSVLSQYMNFETQNLNNDNLKKQGDVLTAEAANKAAQTDLTRAQARRAGFDLDLESELRNSSLDYRKGMVTKQNAEISTMLSDRELRIAQTASNLQEGAERILSSRLARTSVPLEQQRIKADISRIKADTKLKQLDIDLKKLGIQPNDPLYWRFAGRLLGNTSLMDKLKTGFNQTRKQIQETPIKKPWIRLGGNK